MYSALRPGRAILSTNWIGGSIGPRKYLDDMEGSKILTLLGPDLRPQVVQPVASCSMDWATKGCP
jgi:hypothetical protein